MATVASVYAKALFEYAQEKGQLDALFGELKSFQETLDGNSQLSAVLNSPVLDSSGKQALVAEIAKTMKFSDFTARALALLADKRRITDLSAILADLEARVERSQGVVSGAIRSAVVLAPEELSFLSAALSKRVGGKVRLHPSVDPSLLGGVVATVSGKTFDASLRTQLERFRGELI